jgi:acetyl esterase/lipase
MLPADDTERMNPKNFFMMNRRMPGQMLIVVLAGILMTAPAAAQEVVPLWESGKIPGSNGPRVPDSIANERIYRLSEPRMYAFFPSKDDNCGSAVLIFPGGGYTHLALNLGGFQLAKWFNTLGFSAFVVAYRLPNAPGLVHRELAPLQDAQRALQIVRANAGRWGIRPDKIGVLGTSAGGHLAALTATATGEVTGVQDSLRAFSAHPDFMILISPLIDLGDRSAEASRMSLLGPAASAELLKKYSAQNRVTAATPPCLIVHAFNDPVVPVQQSLLFFQALLDKHIPTSFHVFPQGAHQIAVNSNPGSTELWKPLCEAWLKEMGFDRK